MTEIDVNREKLLSLGQASRWFPEVDGRRPSANSLWRWCRRGVRGVRLPYVRVGRRICTSPRAISGFCNRLAAADDPGCQASAPSRPRRDGTSAPPRLRRKQKRAAARVCDAAGI